MSAPGDQPTLGLRERKKAKTRAALQAHALRLFRAQGYDTTTVEQICEAAEISPRSFFRYFPNKASVVLWDEFDPLVVQAFNEQPPELNPLQALRAAFRAVFGQLSAAQLAEQRQRTTLSLSVPELRASMLDHLVQGMDLFSEVLAARTDRASDDPVVRTLAGAVIGAAMSVTFAFADDPRADLATLLDEALEHLEVGLPMLTGSGA